MSCVILYLIRLIWPYTCPYTCSFTCKLPRESSCKPTQRKSNIMDTAQSVLVKFISYFIVDFAWNWNILVFQMLNDKSFQIVSHIVAHLIINLPFNAQILMYIYLYLHTICSSKFHLFSSCSILREIGMILYKRFQLTW